MNAAHLPVELERDVRTLLRVLRVAHHADAFLVQGRGYLRVRLVGREFQRIGCYAVRACTPWEDLGDLIREDVAFAVGLISGRGRGH